MGQAAIGAGGDIKKMETTLEQEGIKGLRAPAALVAAEGIGTKKTAAGLAVGLKHTPGEQGAHVQLGDPGRFQNRQGQGVAQFGLGQRLGLGDEIGLVLQGRQALQHRHNAVKRRLGALVVVEQAGVSRGIGEGMERSTGTAPAPIG